MHFRYHGNWCGPGWSDGRYVSSTHGFAPAIDEFDETCRQHDFALAGGASDPEADAKFFEDNVNKGAKRSVAAYAVAARSAFDNMVQPPTTKFKNKIEMAPKTTKKGANEQIFARVTRWREHRSAYAQERRGARCTSCVSYPPHRNSCASYHDRYRSHRFTSVISPTSQQLAQLHCAGAGLQSRHGRIVPLACKTRSQV